MALEGMFERLLIFGSILILCALLVFGISTANRSAQMDVVSSNELVFASSRGMNTIDAIRFVAKQAELGDPTLSETALAERLAIARSRLRDFQRGELYKIDDAKIQRYVGQLDTIFKRIDAIMDDRNCNQACQGTKLLEETRLAKRALAKVQARGLIVDGRMRRAVDELNASTIHRIFLGSLAFMAFAGLVVFVVGMKNRQLQRQKAELTESQHRLLEVGIYRAQFLAGMSHEFRTPLNAIKGFSQFILMVKGEMPREKLLEYMTDIEKSAVDLEETTNTVLDLSKIDAGTFDLHEKTVDLVQIVHDVKKQFSIGTDGSRLVLNIPETLPVLCDPTAIKRCIQNLVSNAMKFSPSDSKITIDVTDSEKGLQIKVTDQGIGIPKSELKSIWQVYSRSSYTRHSDKQGSGLGLPIIKALIKEHGGRAKLESEIGVGTVATLTLPPSRIKRENELTLKAA